MNELETLHAINGHLEKIEAHLSRLADALETTATVAVHALAPDDDPGELEQPQETPDPSTCPRCGFPDNQKLDSLFAEAPDTKQYVCAQCGHVWNGPEPG